MEGKAEKEKGQKGSKHHGTLSLVQFSTHQSPVPAPWPSESVTARALFSPHPLFHGRRSVEDRREDNPKLFSLSPSSRSHLSLAKVLRSAEIGPGRAGDFVEGIACYMTGFWIFGPSKQRGVVGGEEKTGSGH
ncbi:hypothetical protein H6P81_017095 [Aristolochia fimbriata]|uniref:Uncharacterized protein n=1 Tax=Aristolochia fimbriata TaxID=158543 RepID=A0AAV7E098_ARIFI|nr:hypothetical protein H6P81_017095 [Aristolochia fimbriata]